MEIKKSKFTEWIVRENALGRSGFQEWFFYPGMLFNAMNKWWGNQGKRDRPHEGLDLCFYKNRKGRILQLDESTKIPVLYDGVVVQVINDFIGKSVMVEHRLPPKKYPRLCSIYGHLNFIANLQVGRTVRAGDILATLARPGKASSNIPPHLHLSVGWISDGISFRDLDWDSIGTTCALKWVDPLRAI